MNHLSNRIKIKKMFIKTVYDFGFAPIKLTNNKWCVLMFANKNDFKENKPLNNFMFDMEELNDFKSTWEVACIFKNLINKIDEETKEWEKPTIRIFSEIKILNY